MKPISISKAMSMKFPEWVGLLIVRDADKPNIMPIGWMMCCSFEPPMFAIAVGNSRYTREILLRSPRFVIAFASESQADIVRRTGTSSGRELDKFREFGIPHETGPITGCPLLTQAAMNLECEVTEHMETGDHTIFAARILAAYAPETPVRKLENWGGDTLRPAVPA